MKRRQFVGTLSTGLLAGALRPTGDLLALDAHQLASSSSSTVVTPRAVMAPRADGFEAVWGVDRLCTGRLEWEGPNGTRGTVAATPYGFVPQGERVLRVRVDGLTPGANYRVRAITRTADGSGEEMSTWKDVRTIDPAATETTFVVWNDTHIHDDTIQRLHEVTPAADFLVWNGDTCNDWKTPEILVPTLLNPGGCDITTGRPLLFTFGNHDVRGPHAFEMPDIVATPTDRPFYAFRSGPVAAICLHTGEDKPDDHPSFGGRVAFDALRREQAGWLAEAIRRPELRDAPYRIVFCHIPLRWIDESPQDYAATGFDRHSGRSRAAWHDSLVAWGTQIVVSGHTHRHAWLPPTSEFPYGQLIGGGPAIEAATWMRGHADARELVFEVNALDGRRLERLALAPLSS